MHCSLLLFNENLIKLWCGIINSLSLYVANEIDKLIRAWQDPNPSFQQCFHFMEMFFLLLGHYVVVCGYDLKKKKIFYKNPSYDEGTHYLCQNNCKGSLIQPTKFQSTVDCYHPKLKMLFIHHKLCVNWNSCYTGVYQNKSIFVKLSCNGIVWKLRIKLNFWTAYRRINPHSSDVKYNCPSWNHLSKITQLNVYINWIETAYGYHTHFRTLKVKFLVWANK